MKKDIKPNEKITTFFALEAMRLRTSKNKNNFLELAMQDRTGKIKGYLWDNPVIAAATLKEKSIVKVRGITNLVNDSLIINVEKIRMAEKGETDIGDFLEVVPGGTDLWCRKLFSVVDIIRDTNCRRLVDSFLMDEEFFNLFTASPGGISVHHDYLGGLLEHTATIMEQAAETANRNPGLLDRDLLLTGAFLHDIGKTREFYWEVTREYTTEGKLLGHIAIGVLMLEEKLSKLKGFPGDLALPLKHMILSHHGDLAFGSPVRPATPEAITLNLLDNADAKINHLYKHLGYSNPEETWSGFDKILNTEIYQKRYARQTVKHQEAIEI